MSYSDEVKKVFVRVMRNEACDMAEVIFVSEGEKVAFIYNAWNDYGDDIEAFVDGVGEDVFMNMREDEKEDVMRDAITANAEEIFDKSFNE